MKGTTFNFDPVAKFYDSWYDDPVGKAYDLQEKRAVERVLPATGENVKLLEVGPGTGHWSSWFAAKGFRITGIDISAEMTALATAKNIPGARFIRGDFLEADINGPFHVAAAITSLEFIPDHVAALDKMRSLLLPGGSLIVGALNRRSLLGVTRKLKGEKDPVFHRARFFTTGELRKLLARYGKPRVYGSTFALPFRSLVRTAPALETIGGALCPCFGNFIVGSVMV